MFVLPDKLHQPLRSKYSIKFLIVGLELSLQKSLLIAMCGHELVLPSAAAVNKDKPALLEGPRKKPLWSGGEATLSALPTTSNSPHCRHAADNAQSGPRLALEFQSRGSRARR